MKKEIIVIALIAILFVLVAGSILASFTFYKEYKERTDYLDQQSQLAKSKVDGLEAKFDNYKTTIEDITSQVKGYNESIKNMQNTINLSEEERKNLLARIEEMKKDLQGVQKDYASAVIDIKQSMMSLKDDLDKMESNIKKPVELGKITVKQEEKKAAEIPAQAPAAKAEGSNFKSGNVRKVSGY